MQLVDNRDKVFFYVLTCVFQKLLKFNPHRRISAKEALNHAFFKDDADSVRTSNSLSPTSTSESDSIDSRSDTPVSK